MSPARLDRRAVERLVLARAVVVPPRRHPFRVSVRATAVAGAVAWSLLAVAVPALWPISASAVAGAYLFDRTLGGAW